MFGRLPAGAPRLAFRLLILASAIFSTTASGAPLQATSMLNPPALSAEQSALYAWPDLSSASVIPGAVPSAAGAFFLPNDRNTTGASVAVDSAGGIHVVYSPVGVISGGTYLVYYAYCGSNCGSASNWTYIYIGDAGAFGGYARLAVDSQKRPHAIWYQQTTLDGRGDYVYAKCNANCLQGANWSSIVVTSSTYHPDDARFFALDPQGRPRFLYTDTLNGHTGTYYVYCDSACTSPDNNWWEGQISGEYLCNEFSLAFDSAGRPRVAYRDATGSQLLLAYASCDASCYSGANWQVASPYTLGSQSFFALRLDSSGRPRMAYYQGYTGAAGGDLLSYAWCDTNCTTASNWHLKGLGLAQYYGKGVDLALDNQNKPTLVYFVDVSPYGLSYSRCTSNCESQTPVWQSQFVETTAELNAINPVPVASGCSISSWYPGDGNRPSVALNAAGVPQIGYDNRHLQAGSCAARTDIQLVRFSSGGGASGGQVFIYLPLVLKGQ